MNSPPRPEAARTREHATLTSNTKGFGIYGTTSLFLLLLNVKIRKKLATAFEISKDIQRVPLVVLLDLEIRFDGSAPSPLFVTILPLPLRSVLSHLSSHNSRRSGLNHSGSPTSLSLSRPDRPILRCRTNQIIAHPTKVPDDSNLDSYT